MDGHGQPIAGRLMEPMGPFDELERVDLLVEHAALDEHMTHFDPDSHPKPPHPKEEGITDLEGWRPVDLMFDTPRLDTMGTFDLSPQELRDFDVK